MATSLAGINRIVLCEAGTALTTAGNAMALGFRSPGSLDITPFKDIKDYRSRSLRNMLNFKFEAESYQTSLYHLKQLIYFCNCNADCELVSSKQNAQGDQDVFQFFGDNIIGIDFEHTISVAKRSTKITLERAMEYDRAKTLIDSADSATAMTYTDMVNAGESDALYRSPYYMAFECPKSTELFPLVDIVDRSLTIKTKGKKTEYNLSKVDYLNFVLKITGREASIEKLITQMGKDMSAGVYFKEKNTGSYFDAFEFEPGILTLKDEFKIADDDRNITVTFEADVPLFDIDIQTGVSAGGSETDDNAGGTMRIGESSASQT